MSEKQNELNILENKTNEQGLNYKLRADKTIEEELLTFMLPSNSCISGMAKI